MRTLQVRGVHHQPINPQIGLQRVDVDDELALFRGKGDPVGGGSPRLEEPGRTECDQPDACEYDNESPKGAGDESHSRGVC